jgi:hypothetical protein
VAVDLVRAQLQRRLRPVRTRVTVPTLFIELTGDQAAFRADSRRMTRALGAEDLTTATVRGLHFGGPIAKGEPAGNELAAAEIIAWLAKRHELTPPA